MRITMTSQSMPEHDNDPRDYREDDGADWRQQQEQDEQHEQENGNV